MFTTLIHYICFYTVVFLILILLYNLHVIRKSDNSLMNAQVILILIKVLTHYL